MMMDWVLSLANNPATAWWVLGLMALAAAYEMIRTSRETLWGDFLADDLDE